MCAVDWVEKRSQPGEAAGCGKADETNETPVFIVYAAIIGRTPFPDYCQCAGLIAGCTAPGSFICR